MDGPFRSAAERHAIEAEAARLLLKARASDAEGDWEAAYRWVARDPAHGYAFAKAEAAWDLAGRLRETDKILPGTGRGTAREARGGGGAAPRDPASPRPLTRPWLTGALAASLVAAAGTVALQLRGTVDHYRTAVGERRVVRLADGSVIRLNTGSSVEVALGARRRTVHLLRGEAAFDVASDPARPFVVDADGASVRAVGTAFVVRLRPDLTEVTVTHGVVAVRDRGAAERRIAAGRAAAVREGAIAVTPLARADLSRRLAWQQGRLTFTGDTLERAVAEFNRYRATPLVIGDPALAGIRIGGTFEIDRSEDFARALHLTFGIRTLPAADGSLLLVPGET